MIRTSRSVRSLRKHQSISIRPSAGRSCQSMVACRLTRSRHVGLLGDAVGARHPHRGAAHGRHLVWRGHRGDQPRQHHPGPLTAAAETAQDGLDVAELAGQVDGRGAEVEGEAVVLHPTNLGACLQTCLTVPQRPDPPGANGKRLPAGGYPLQSNDGHTTYRALAQTVTLTNPPGALGTAIVATTTTQIDNGWSAGRTAYRRATTRGRGVGSESRSFGGTGASKTVRNGPVARLAMAPCQHKNI